MDPTIQEAQGYSLCAALAGTHWSKEVGNVGKGQGHSTSLHPMKRCSSKGTPIIHRGTLGLGTTVMDCLEMQID